MIYRITFRRAARTELEEAVDWYEMQKQGPGIEFLAEIEAAVDRLAENPERFAVVQGDVRRVGARRFPYNVYFRIRASQVVVLAVFHARRNPGAWQRRT